MFCSFCFILNNLVYYLKYAVGMLYFHCKKRQHIQQEIYASILLYNYANLIIQNIKKKMEIKKTKYIYNINVRSALTNIRNYFRNQIKESILIRNIKKYLTPSRPDRNVQRSIKRQSPKALNNRTSCQSYSNIIFSRYHKFFQPRHRFF